MVAEPPGDGARFRALVALVGVLALALAGLAYLVGREAGRRETPTTTLRAAPVAPLATAPNQLAREVPPAAPPSQPTPEDEDVYADWDSLGDDLEADSVPPEPGEPAPDEAVRSYFAALDAIEQDAKYWDNPQDLATALLSQMQSGDASGFDELVSRQRDALARIDRLSAPPACADYHQRVRALMSEGVRLLERVRDAAVQGDAAGLLELPGEAEGLATRAREVDALGKEIRHRNGLE